MLWLPWIWSTRLQRRRFPGTAPFVTGDVGHEECAALPCWLKMWKVFETPLILDSRGAVVETTVADLKTVLLSCLPEPESCPKLWTFLYRWTLNGNASKQNRSQLFLFLQRYLINFTQLWLDLEILLWKIMGLLLASCSQNIQHHQTWSRPITPCAALIDVSNYFFVCSQEALSRDSLIFVQK